MMFFIVASSSCCSGHNYRDGGHETVYSCLYPRLFLVIDLQG